MHVLLRCVVALGTHLAISLAPTYKSHKNVRKRRGGGGGEGSSLRFERVRGVWNVRIQEAPGRAAPVSVSTEASTRRSAVPTAWGAKQGVWGVGCQKWGVGSGEWGVGSGVWGVGFKVEGWRGV
jgi:hypothetical protein